MDNLINAFVQISTTCGKNNSNLTTVKFIVKHILVIHVIITCNLILLVSFKYI